MGHQIDVIPSATLLLLQPWKPGVPYLDVEIMLEVCLVALAEGNLPGPMDVELVRVGHPLTLKAVKSHVVVIWWP